MKQRYLALFLVILIGFSSCMPSGTIHKGSAKLSYLYVDGTTFKEWYDCKCHSSTLEVMFRFKINQNGKLTLDGFATDDGIAFEKSASLSLKIIKHTHLPLHRHQFYLGNLEFKRSNTDADGNEIGFESIYADIKENPAKFNVLFVPIIENPDHPEFKNHVAYEVMVIEGFKLPDIEAQSNSKTRIDPSPPATSK